MIASLPLSVIWYFTLKSARTWLINSVSLDPLNIERTVPGFTSIPIIFYDRYYPSNNLDRSRANDCRLSAPLSLSLSNGPSKSRWQSDRISFSTEPMDQPFEQTCTIFRFADGNDADEQFSLHFASTRSPPSMDPSFPDQEILLITGGGKIRFCLKKNNDPCLPNFPFRDQTTRKPVSSFFFFRVTDRRFRPGENSDGQFRGALNLESRV